jgi:hypothetical protein
VSEGDPHEEVGGEIISNERCSAWEIGILVLNLFGFGWKLRCIVLLKEYIFSLNKLFMVIMCKRKRLETK